MAEGNVQQPLYNGRVSINTVNGICEAFGKVVTLRPNLTSLSASATRSIVIPSEYRPVTDTYVPLFYYNGTAYVFDGHNIGIRANGTVVICGSEGSVDTSLNYNFCFFNAVWITQ